MKKLLRGEFSVDGISLYEKFKVRVEHKTDVLLPPLRSRKVSIPHRNGKYDFGAKYREERTLRLDCSIPKVISRAELREFAFLLSKKANLRFWDEPDKCYIGQLYNPDELERLAQGQCRFSLEFTCEPFALGETKEIPIKTGINKLDYKGTAETPTLLVLKNNSTTAAQLVQIKAVFRR